MSTNCYFSLGAKGLLSHLSHRSNIQCCIGTDAAKLKLETGIMEELQYLYDPSRDVPIKIKTKFLQFIKI